MSDRGFLLGSVDALTSSWVSSWSIAAIPPLRRNSPGVVRSQQSARDIFVTVWLILAVLGAFLAGRSYPLWLGHGIAAVGLYRALDLLISFFRAGVFLSFRGDIDIAREPRWRIQRLLLATFINFFELILWYATVYRYASRAQDSNVICMLEAVNGSFSVMTTLGNSIAPTSWSLTALIAVQWFTSILMLVVVVGLLVSLLTAEQNAKIETPGDSPPSGWPRPLFITCILLASFYVFLWLAFTS